MAKPTHKSIPGPRKQSASSGLGADGADQLGDAAFGDPDALENQSTAKLYRREIILITCSILALIALLFVLFFPGCQDAEIDKKRDEYQTTLADQILREQSGQIDDNAPLLNDKITTTIDTFETPDRVFNLTVPQGFIRDRQSPHYLSNIQGGEPMTRMEGQYGYRSFRDVSDPATVTSTMDSVPQAADFMDAQFPASDIKRLEKDGVVAWSAVARDGWHLIVLQKNMKQFRLDYYSPNRVYKEFQQKVFDEL